MGTPMIPIHLGKPTSCTGTRRIITIIAKLVTAISMTAFVVLNPTRPPPAVVRAWGLPFTISRTWSGASSPSASSSLFFYFSIRQERSVPSCRRFWSFERLKRFRRRTTLSAHSLSFLDTHHSRRRPRLGECVGFSHSSLQQQLDDNPTLDWKGVAHSTSPFVHHVRIVHPEKDPEKGHPPTARITLNLTAQTSEVTTSPEDSTSSGTTVIRTSGTWTVLEVVEQVLQQRRAAQNTLNFHIALENHPATQASDPPPQHREATWWGIEAEATDLSAQDLLTMGAVWYLPASAPRDPSLGAKPQRWHRRHHVVQPGDYLRIHVRPRRFPQVYAYNWTLPVQPDDLETVAGSDTGDKNGEKRGVVVAENAEKGWLVLDKPAMVPVHMTVDNCLENVAACLQSARRHQQQQEQRPPQVVTRSSQLTVDDDQNDDDHPEENEPYVSTPQRLDQNTSGLLVVATSKAFAHYFATLLSSKTEQMLEVDRSNSTGDTVVGGVFKLYRCLVCLMEPTPSSPENNRADPTHECTNPTTVTNPTDVPWSVERASAELHTYAETGQVIRHYLEPSIRAPKCFVPQSPAGATWPECMLRIRKAGLPTALMTDSSHAGPSLAQALWSCPREIMPSSCRAVMELEIELLTGRTHQIRGQMAALGFPLVGDSQYGGAIPLHTPPPSRPMDLREYFIKSERLALQCCELHFLEPQVVHKEDESITMTRSNQWNHFRLDHAWWTPLLQQYHDLGNGRNSMQRPEQHVEMENNAAVAGTNGYDVRPEGDFTSHAVGTPVGRVPTETIQPIDPSELLPGRVSLSPGTHKYVLVRATYANDSSNSQDATALHHDQPYQEQWFVKSASPQECGGYYHGNVAQDLLEWIKAAGYEATVMGGGRIDYRPHVQQVYIYGFSYGFGRADHERAAHLIRTWKPDLQVTVDNTDGLY